MGTSEFRHAGPWSGASVLVSLLTTAALLAGVIVWWAPGAGADTPLGETGLVGTNYLFDEASNPGARCLYDPGSGAFTITVDGPYVLGLNRVEGAEQTEVSWRATALQDGQVVLTSAPVTGGAFGAQSANFAAPIVLSPPGLAGRFTARVEITWFDSTPTGPPIVLGTSLRQVDVYAQNLDGTAGPDAIVDACQVLPDPTSTATTAPVPTSTTIPTTPPTATATLPANATATLAPTSTPTGTIAPTATSTPAAIATSTSTPNAAATATPPAGPSGPPRVALSTQRSTVNTALRIDLAGFPANKPVEVSFAGVTVASITTTSGGTATATIAVPAKPQGTYEIRAAVDTTTATASFTVAPRIKLTPGTGGPGDSIGVSLRGFGKNERVRIRWLVDGRYVEVDVVERTSNTGSANLSVPVPAGADPGATSVRGDGTIARAQTNVFVVTP